MRDGTKSCKATPPEAMNSICFNQAVGLVPVHNVQMLVFVIVDWFSLERAFFRDCTT